MKKTRPALFENYMVENGQRRRATRAELAEAHRLWWKHADIRTGRFTEIHERGQGVRVEATQGVRGTSGRTAA